MKTKVHKQSELKMLKDKLPKSTITVFTTFSRAGEKGLSVAQMQELKRAMRSMKSEYLIAKKSLVDIATRDLKYDGVDIYGMQGSVGVVMGQENPYDVAKKLYEFAKKNQALKFFGAIVDGTFVAKEGFIEMALMPSREVLLARLLGMMMYPVSSLAMVLKQVADKKAADAPAPAPTPAPAAEPAPVAEAPSLNTSPSEVSGEQSAEPIVVAEAPVE